MGFVHKGGVWWFLLLAGALLAAAAVGAEQEDGAAATAVAELEAEVGQRAAGDQANDMCDLKCQHWQDPAGRRRCVNECHSREHHHPSRAFCEVKCQHHHDPTRKENCVQQCMSYGVSLRVGGTSDVVDKRSHTSEVEVGQRAADEQANDMCDLKCQHWQDPAGRQRCVNECHSREHHHPTRAFCEVKCQHHHDPTRKENCVQQCMSYGLSLRVGGSGGVDGHLDGGGETVAEAIMEVV